MGTDLAKLLCMTDLETAALASDSEFLALCDARRADWIDATEAATAEAYVESCTLAEAYDYATEKK